MKDYWQNYIDGAWVDGGAGRVDIINPGTGETLAQQALADEADIDRAVQAARRVHLSGVLTDMRPVERGRMVQAMGRYLLDNRDALVLAVTLLLVVFRDLTEGIVVGFVLAVLMQLAVFPVMGLAASVPQSLGLGAVFTGTSLARSYLLRRLFTRWGG